MGARIGITAAVAALAVAGCGSTAPPTAPSAPAPAKQGQSRPKARAMSAAQVVQSFKRAGLPIGRTEPYTETTDPNHLLDRPGQYTSKANFIDRRVRGQGSPGPSIDSAQGGSVEVFATPTDAATRARYVRTVTQSASALTEYDFLQGRTLLRLSKVLTPTQANAYKAALTR